MIEKGWLKSVMPKIGGLWLAILLLASLVLPLLPTQVAKAAPSKPVLPLGVQYYEVKFPTGLTYSQGWYGTFSYAPPANVILYDDSYTPDFGRAIISMPLGKSPTGAQGGTSITSINQTQAQSIINSYNIKEYTPIDPEILQVMPLPMHFNGVWSGDKLANKWTLDTPPPTLSQKQKDYLESVKDTIALKKTQFEKTLVVFDPDRFWVGDGGNWSDNATHWSAATGGAPGASLPTSADNVFFDANSFTLAAQTVTVNVAATVLSMNWTGVTNAPTLGVSGGQMSIYGSLTFISNMTVNFVGTTFVFLGTGSQTVTTGGLIIAAGGLRMESATLIITITDSWNSPNNSLSVRDGVLITNGATITTATLGDNGSSNAKTLTFGASIINCSAFSFGSGNLTITANTAIINVSGTGAFAGGGMTTYNNVNLTGSAHTISGNNTFNALGLNPSAAQAVTFTDGTIQTVASLSRTGTGQITLQGSGAGGWGITKSGIGVNDISNITLSNSTGSPNLAFSARGGSIDAGGNVGWGFPHNVTTLSASGVSMNSTGVTAVTTRGTLDDLGGSANNVWFEWGLTAAYGNVTTNVSYSSGNYSGIKTATLPTNLTPDATYHFRIASNNGTVTVYGADDTFALTMSTPVTSAPTVSKASETAYHFILNGSISNMGVASSVNYAFRWGYSAATMTNVVGAGVALGIGSFSADIGNILAGNTVYYQFYNTVGAVEATGSTQSGTGAITPTVALDALLPLLVLLVGIVVSLKMVANGQVTGIQGLLLIFIVMVITVAILTSTNSIVTTP